MRNKKGYTQWNIKILSYFIYLELYPELNLKLTLLSDNQIQKFRNIKYTTYIFNIANYINIYY